MSKRMDKKELIESLKGLIVSCQTQPDDPIHTDKMVVKMAEAAKWGGAVGIRANSPEQIAAIKAEVDLPIIGLWKIWHDNTDVFITPTLEACKAVWEAGADIIMLDIMDDDTIKEAFKLIAGRAETECSGNVTKERLKTIREIGVDYVSCGALTHSAPIMDISLKNLHPVE